jgi:hypothetical protein
MLNFKFKSTIVELNIFRFPHVPDQFEDIIAYTSQFPNLTSLKLTGNEFIDFNRLLLANPKLRKRFIG